MNRTRILLVEDNPGDAFLLLEALQGTGWNPSVVAVADGGEALGLLQDCASRPDLLVMDLNLPGLDGRQILARVRRDPGLAAMPVVVLSGSGREREEARAQGVGEGNYLIKPDSFTGYQEIAARLEGIWRGQGAGQ